jgi:hypothetical protein
MFAYLKLNTEFGRVVPYYPFMMKVYERILPRQAVSVPVKVPVRTGTHTLSNPFFYSYVHTMFGSFLPPSPTPSLTTLPLPLPLYTLAT